MQKSRPKVFVVDDEQIIAETLAIILQKSGFDAECFTDPRRALDAARLGAPALLLSDVMMPELSGVDLAVAIRQTCPECKILLFSGHAETVDLMARVRAQGHDFHVLTKPLHPADLLRRIRNEDPAWALGAR